MLCINGILLRNIAYRSHDQTGYHSNQIGWLSINSEVMYVITIKFYHRMFNIMCGEQYPVGVC